MRKITETLNQVAVVAAEIPNKCLSNARLGLYSHTLLLHICCYYTSTIPYPKFRNLKNSENRKVLPTPFTMQVSNVSCVSALCKSHVFLLFADIFGLLVISVCIFLCRHSNFFWLRRCYVLHL